MAAVKSAVLRVEESMAQKSHPFEDSVDVPKTAGPTGRATSYDVARAAGVAQSTVSRCFKDDSNISEETRLRVRRVASELGYTPNALARSLITRRSNMVGVIATKFTIRNNPELVYALADALKGAGIALLLMVVEDDASVESTLPEALAYPLDGLISCVILDAEQIERFSRRGVAVVFFNRDVRGTGVDCISTDQAEGARQLAAALHAAGHRRILCVGGPPEAPVSWARTDGFIRAFEALGGGKVEQIAGNFSYQSGHDAFLAYLKGSERPQAVFCANDQLALGVMDACRYALDLSVPADISVVGFDDVAEAGRPPYRLTTMQQQIESMASRAVDLVLRRIADPSVTEESILIRGKLIRRGSARL